MPRRPEEEEDCWGFVRKMEKEQARCGYFNVINDRTPLRVCFNNQDTLQQVDRMFAVNLHMSSERAVSVNNGQALRMRRSLSWRPRPAGSTQSCGHPLLSCPPLLCLQAPARGEQNEGRWMLLSPWAIWSGSLLPREFPGLPIKIRASELLVQKTHCGYYLRLESGSRCLNAAFPRNFKLPLLKLGSE